MDIKRYFRIDRSNCFESKLIDFLMADPALVNLKKELRKPLLKLNENQQRIYFSEACEVAKRKAAIITKEGVFKVKKDDKDDFYLDRIKGIRGFYIRLASRNIKRKRKEDCYLPSYHNTLLVSGFSNRVKSWIFH